MGNGRTVGTVRSKKNRARNQPSNDQTSHANCARKNRATSTATGQNGRPGSTGRRCGRQPRAGAHRGHSQWNGPRRVTRPQQRHGRNSESGSDGRSESAAQRDAAANGATARRARAAANGESNTATTPDKDRRNPEPTPAPRKLVGAGVRLIQKLRRINDGVVAVLSPLICCCS